MKCIVNDVEFETMEEICKFVRENITTDDFNDMLDEKYGEIDICGYEFSASYVFACADNYLYDREFNDFVNEIVNEIVDRLEDVYDDDTFEMYGFTFECITDEEV